MQSNNVLKHAAVGAAAGLVGTFVIHALRAIDSKYFPKGSPPIRRDPGEFMVHQSERALPARTMQKIPESVEHAAAKTLGIGYGMTFGALYGAARGQGGSIGVDGPALGLACWAAGYLGWLPATGLMPPVWRQTPSQAIIPVVEHALYGVATTAAYDAMHHFLRD